MKAKKLLINLAIFLLSSFIIAYIIIQLVSGLTTDVAYQYAATSNVDNFIEKESLIIRNETVLYAEEEGVLTYHVKEGSKVGQNQAIATVFESSQGVELQNQIDKIDEKIALLERCSVDSSYQTSDISKIDSKIYSALISNRLAVLEDNIGLTSQYKDELLLSFNKRELITTSKTNFDEEIEALRAEKTKLTSSLENSLCSVVCNTPGYFSTLLDGYETVYSTDSIQDLSVDSFHSLMDQNENEYSKNAIGKMITDFHWYTLCEVTNLEAEEFAENHNYKLSFLYSADRQIPATLEKIVRQTDCSTCVLVFRIEDIPNHFDYTRKQPVKIIKHSVEGVSFPRSALRVVDGVQGVYIIAGNTVDFRKVDIIHSTDSLYISHDPSELEDGKKYLSRFDRVITEGKNLYVGKILD